MKKVVDDIRLMIKVCDMYYNQNMNQQGIAAALGLSRPTVSRLLSSAKEEGVVTINISNLEEIRYWELERALEDRFHLKEVLIADSCTDEKDLMENLGRMAGHYIKQKIHSDDVVGVSMGRTLRKMVEYVDRPEAERVTFVPMVGGMGQLRTELHANSIAEALANIYGGIYIPFHAPARVSTRKMRDELMKEQSLSQAVSMMKKIDIAILGIGYPNDRSSIAATGYYDEKAMDQLRERAVAGDICMQFYDKTGDTSPYEDENNVIGYDIHQLHRIPVRIGIAGGIQKLPSVQGAISGRYINALITDEECARALLEEG